MSTKNQKEFAELFLIIIDYVLIHKDYGEDYLKCLLHNPKEDLGDDYELYKKIINTNPIIDLRHVFLDLNNNKIDDAFKHIDIVFENAISSSSNEKLYNEWFLELSQDIYGMFKELKIVIDKMNQSHSPIDFKELFKTRIERVRKVTVKRTHTETEETIEEEITKTIKTIRKLISKKKFEKSFRTMILIL